MSSPVVPIALGAAALIFLSGKKSKKSSSSSGGGGNLPKIYIPEAPPPKIPQSGGSSNSSSAWMARQRALTYLSQIHWGNGQVRINLCSKCDPKGIDGKVGPNTRAAVRAFQALSGLPVTGNWGQSESDFMTKALNSLDRGNFYPCDPLRSAPAPLGCFIQPNGEFGLMPSFDSLEESNHASNSSPNPTAKPEPQDPTEPPGEASEFGPDELLVADGDCNYIIHQDDRFFIEQNRLIIQSALEGLTDDQAADDIHEEMMNRYIPMCLFLGKDKVGEGVRTWWNVNLGHVAGKLKSYELMPEMLEEDAYEYGLI